VIEVGTDRVSGWGCVESQAYSSTFLGFVDVDCEVDCGDYSGEVLD
jgi:hypothetical protein